MKLFIIVLALSVLTVVLGIGLTGILKQLLRGILDLDRDLRISIDEVRQFLNRCDANGNGIVTYLELSVYIRACNILFVGDEGDVFTLFSPSIKEPIVIANVADTVDITRW